MTDNTNTNAIIARRARQWAKDAKAAPNIEYSVETLAAIEFVLANTNEPTMADVEWDDEKHHMAGATLPGGGEVVMVWPDAHNPDLIITKEGEWARQELTPNGKRYETVETTGESAAVRADEPDEPVHPAVLVTEEDYENAPAGAIVDIDNRAARHSLHGWHLSGVRSRFTSYEMSRLGVATVIRWDNRA